MTGDYDAEDDDDDVCDDLRLRQMCDWLPVKQHSRGVERLETRVNSSDFSCHSDQKSQPEDQLHL